MQIKNSDYVSGVEKHSSAKLNNIIQLVIIFRSEQFLLILYRWLEQQPTPIHVKISRQIKNFSFQFVWQLYFMVVRYRRL